MSRLLQLIVYGLVFLGCGGFYFSNQTRAAETNQTITGASLHFQYDLMLGQTDKEVQRLQRLLNNKTETQVALPGELGGSGQETMYYGELTAEAVKKFQAQHPDIVQSGLFNTETRLLMNTYLDQMVTQIQITITRILEILAAMKKEKRTKLTPEESAELTTLLTSSSEAVGALQGAKTESSTSVSGYFYDSNGNLIIGANDASEVSQYLTDDSGNVIGYCLQSGQCYYYDADGNVVLASGTTTVTTVTTNTTTSGTTSSGTVRTGTPACSGEWCAVCTNASNVKFDGDIYTVTVYSKSESTSLDWLDESTQKSQKSISYYWSYGDKEAVEQVKSNESSFAVVYDTANDNQTVAAQVTIEGSTVNPVCVKPQVISADEASEIVSSGGSTAGAKVQNFDVSCVVDGGSIKDKYTVGDKVIYSANILGANSSYTTTYNWTMLQVSQDASAVGTVSYDKGPFVVRNLTQSGDYDATLIVQNYLDVKSAQCPTLTVVDSDYADPLPFCKISEDVVRTDKGSFSASIQDPSWKEPAYNENVASSDKKPPYDSNRFRYYWTVDPVYQMDISDSYYSLLHTWQYYESNSVPAKQKGDWQISVSIYYDLSGKDNATPSDYIKLFDIDCLTANGSRIVQVI